MYLKSIFNKIAKILFLQLFSLLFILKLLNGQNRKFLKNSNRNIPKTPGKIHMYDMVKIDTIVSCLKCPGACGVKNNMTKVYIILCFGRFCSTR